MPFPAPGGDFDAVDDDLPVALGGELPRLRHRIFKRQGAHPPAGVGDDAVGAEIVAAVLDLQQRPRPLGKAAGGQLLERARKARVLDVLPAELFRGGRRQFVQKFRAAVRADEYIHVELPDLLRRGLRVAAAYADHRVRIELPRTPDGVARFFVGDRRDGAGVDDVAVADAVEFTQRVAARQKELLHGLRLVLIHLTS